MGIEELLTGLATALNRNSDLLERVLAHGAKAAAPENVVGSTKPNSDNVTSPKTEKTPNADTPAAPKGAAKKAATKAPKGPDEAALRAAFGGYLSVEDKGERERRRLNVKGILDHFGAGKATEIPQENWADAIAYVEQFANGETPNFMAEGDEGGEEEDESLV